MTTTLLLTGLAALTQAHILPPLPILSVRDPLANTSTPAPAGGTPNSTYPGFDSLSHPAYSHSAAWKVYIAFLVLGIFIAVLVPALGFWIWFRARRGKGKKQGGRDVEMSGLQKLKARAMAEGVLRPQGAHVRPERYA
ncbi:hypothetical protein B5807_02650 [Epicoccum nigrum]|uniref:Uncharacterized protein n=1 Tax=Epicoccum nigrum TaxID=105696 RepID=A0A1Y2MDL7_EPING|nr:hypothetical protein B5807_02650 [Epicoccum nigrum]